MQDDKQRGTVGSWLLNHLAQIVVGIIGSLAAAFLGALLWPAVNPSVEAGAPEVVQTGQGNLESETRTTAAQAPPEDDEEPDDPPEDTTTTTTTSTTTTSTTTATPVATPDQTQSSNSAEDDLGLIRVDLPDGWTKNDGRAVDGIGPSLTIGESASFLARPWERGALIVSSDLFTGESIETALQLLGFDFRWNCSTWGDNTESSDARISRLSSTPYLDCSTDGSTELNLVEAHLLRRPGDSFTALVVIGSGSPTVPELYQENLEASSEARNTILFSLDIG